MRENPIKSGIGRQRRPSRQFASASTAKNAVEAATCPEGNAWERELNFIPFQTSSVLIEGRARPAAILTTRADAPARASATSIAKKTRIHFLLCRHQAPASNPMQ